MEFPLISREMIAILKLVHGMFNLTVVMLFFYHARNGLLIRRARKNSAPLPLQAIKHHRKMGPTLALLGAGGFSAGLLLVLVDTGNPLLYPAHLLAGVAIVTLLFFTWRVSLKITGQTSKERELHFRLGLAILALYLVNVLLGIGVLL